jgi:hypothetical protein
MMIEIPVIEPVPIMPRIEVAIVVAIIPAIVGAIRRIRRHAIHWSVIHHNRRSGGIIPRTANHDTKPNSLGLRRWSYCHCG